MAGRSLVSRLIFRLCQGGTRHSAPEPTPLLVGDQEALPVASALGSRLELQVALLSRTFLRRHAQERHATGLCPGLEHKQHFPLAATVRLATRINAGAENSPGSLCPQRDPRDRIPRIPLFLHPRFLPLGPSAGDPSLYPHPKYPEAALRMGAPQR